MSHPPRNVTGYQITWPLKQTLHYSNPPRLIAELSQAGVPFKYLLTMYRGDLRYIDDALANIESRIRSLQYLMQTYEADVVWDIKGEALG